jgi:type IV secretory pathway VirB10-like protein
MTATVADSPFRVIEPVATRLNRNALLLVVGLLAVTVAVAVMSLSPGRHPHGIAEGADSVAAAPVRPQRPVLPVRPVAAAPSAVEVGVASAPAPAGIAFEQRRPARSSGAVSAGYRGPVGGGSHAGGSDPTSWDTAYDRALVSKLMVDDGAGRDTVPFAAGDSLGGSRVEVSTAPVPVTDGASDRQAAGHDPERERAAFLRGATGPSEVARAPAVEAPVTAYELEAGTVIPAALVTTVNSDLPGTIVAQVSRDVYDSRTESTVLVPKGTRLIGAYDDRIVSGQSRVLVAWTRMVFPDGRSIRLPGVAGVDGTGAAGVEGSVNDHMGHVFATAALMSGLSAGAQLSQPEAIGGTYAAPSAGQVAAGALGQEMSTVGLEMVRQGLSVKPTITVRGGVAVQVMLAQDVVFTTGYVDGRR